MVELWMVGVLLLVLGEMAARVWDRSQDREEAERLAEKVAALEARLDQAEADLDKVRGELAYVRSGAGSSEGWGLYQQAFNQMGMNGVWR